MLGKVLQLRQFWKINERDLTRAESHIFIVRIDISSGPCAFCTLRDFISLSISSFSNDSDESLQLVLYD